MERQTNATENALSEAQSKGNNERQSSEVSDNDTTNSRSFNLTDIWNIRRSARGYKIHNRRPRI